MIEVLKLKKRSLLMDIQSNKKEEKMEIVQATIKKVSSIHDWEEVSKNDSAINQAKFIIEEDENDFDVEFEFIFDDL